MSFTFNVIPSYTEKRTVFLHFSAMDVTGNMELNEYEREIQNVVSIFIDTSYLTIRQYISQWN